MIKHVGKHNGRKVALAFRTVPDEEHMALVMYTDSLPSLIHDEAMKVLESEIGQNAKELADALHRHIMPDGNNCLTALHKGGWLKKVPCNQVIVTPSASSTLRLDQLNDLLTKMAEGEDAVKKLADIDANRGIKGVLNEGRDLGEPAKTTSSSVNTDVGALSDADLAEQRISQATHMEAEAKSLLAEAKRLKEEAKQFAQTPTTKKTNVRTTTSKSAKKATA
jgi:hypothetical protein